MTLTETLWSPSFIHRRYSLNNGLSFQNCRCLHPVFEWSLIRLGTGLGVRMPPTYGRRLKSRIFDFPAKVGSESDGKGKGLVSSVGQWDYRSSERRVYLDFSHLYSNTETKDHQSGWNLHLWKRRLQGREERDPRRRIQSFLVKGYHNTLINFPRVNVIGNLT